MYLFYLPFLTSIFSYYRFFKWSFDKEMQVVSDQGSGGMATQDAICHTSLTHQRLTEL